MHVHEAASLFPLMTDEEYAGLRDDIRAHGLREPLVIDKDGLLIDGRNRLRACGELGIEPNFRTFEGGSVTDYVMSLNLHRRHLNESQRAMVAANAKPMYEAEARKRQATSTGGKRPQLSLNCGQGDNGKAAAHAAKAANVSRASTERACTILKRGSSALVEKVKRGELSINAALKVAAQPEEVQDRLSALSAKEIKAEVRKFDPRPSPAEARRQAIALGVPVSANNGYDILPMSQAEEEALGRYCVTTGHLFEAVLLLSECKWSAEKVIEAAEKWTCTGMSTAVIKAYDFLERVMYAYARNETVKAGD